MISDTYVPFISYLDISPWILSCLLSYRSLIITLFYPTHPTVTHDLTLISIKRRRGLVLDHFGCVFIYLSDFRFNIFHDGKVWQIVDLLVTMFSLWQLACWVLLCLLFAFWAQIIIVVIHQLVLFCQHGVMIHGPVWHYLSEVGHFHHMMDEHILEYSGLEAFCISVCSSSHTGAYPLLREH